MSCWAPSADLPPRLRDLCGVDKLFKVSYWAPGAEATTRKNVINDIYYVDLRQYMSILSN